MAERKSWSEKEDNALREIINGIEITKWSQVALIMKQKYQIEGRTGKQCRQRWHNQLDPLIKKDSWSQQEEQLLFKLHNQYGNKWAIIAKHLVGRTDNWIKNHFYSTIRKSARKLNKYIADNKLRGEFKTITNLMLYKLIGVAEDKFEKKHMVTEELIQKCNDIKQRLLKYSKQQQISTDEEKQIKNIIKDILEFNRVYRKKKSKKKKTDDSDFDSESIQESLKQQLTKTIPKSKHKLVSTKQQQQSDEIQHMIVMKPVTEVINLPQKKTVEPAPNFCASMIITKVDSFDEVIVDLENFNRFNTMEFPEQPVIGNMNLERSQAEMFNLFNPVGSMNMNGSWKYDSQSYNLFERSQPYCKETTH